MIVSGVGQWSVLSAIEQGRRAPRSRESRTGLEERLGPDRFHLHIYNARGRLRPLNRAEQPPARAQPGPAAAEPVTNENKKPPTPNG